MDDSNRGLNRFASFLRHDCSDGEFASEDVHYICEDHIIPQQSHQQPHSPKLSKPHYNTPHKFESCPGGHLTHDFLSCDVLSACWARDMQSSVTCLVPMTPRPPMFTCISRTWRVPYTFVCDHRPDCADQSDEDFCEFPACPRGFIPCGNKQCIPHEQQCDEVEQCTNGVDELLCKRKPTGLYHDSSPPGVVHFTGSGSFTISPLSLTSLNSSSASLKSSPCPVTHFLCPDHVDFFCLPVYVICNGVYDCPGKEDEMGCESYTCPGYYRCRASRICVHPAKHVCDGHFHCPQHDDELFCNTSCPYNCTCYGNAFYCPQRFPVHAYPNLRFLEGRGSGLVPTELENERLLNYLSLAFCDLHHVKLPTLNSLHILDLSDNHLTIITSQQLSYVTKLRRLTLAGNPLLNIFIGQHFPFLVDLDLSRVKLVQFNVSVIAAFPNLQTVNMSHSGVQTIHGKGFGILKKLRVLDLSGCPMTSFPSGVMHGLQDLVAVYADNYKLCCPLMLPHGFNFRQCLAPSDEISSCQALLRSDLYRVLLSVFASLALFGNLVSLVFRVKSTTTNNSGFGVFVTHLCVSDFVMGIYLAMIGVADRLYLGSYLWKDTEWKQSAMCQLAGFLSLLSSEVSAFIICLITLDRFLVLRFPFSSLRFGQRSAHAVCVAAWCVGLTLAALPLLPATSHWRYYSQTGICVPLPVTKTVVGGQQYSFGVMIVLNFLLFVLIAAGQLVIYLSVVANRISSDDTSRKNKDLTIARRLITVAMSDFLCWFPIGLLGLLASTGVPIPGEVNVVMAIVVLPLNSALNPFLYTLNLVLERRRQAREQRMTKLFSSQGKIHGGTHDATRVAMDKLKLSYTKQDVSALIPMWLADNLLSTDELKAMTGNKP